MRLFAICVLLIGAAATAVAQSDPGVPDTVRVASTALSSGQAAVEVTLVNDEPLSGLQVPLHFSTDLLILDSVVFGTRTAGFAGDDIVRWDADLGGTQQTVMLAVVPLQTGAVAAGSDVLATLYFTQNGGSAADTSVISDTSLVPAGEVLLADTTAAAQVYRPQFSGGVVYVASSISDDVATLPLEFELLPNYPNPFNPATSFAVALPEPVLVTLDIFNLLGQRVKRLYDGPAPAGYLELTWNGRDESGRAVGSGIYFYRVMAGEESQVRKMVLLK